MSDIMNELQQILEAINELKAGFNRLNDTVCGNPDTEDDRGMVGDIVDTKAQMRVLEKKIIKAEASLKKVWQYFYILITLLLSITGWAIRGAMR